MIMTTIRVQKHERNFTIIQNEAIQDKSLSLKARGLHHLLLSYPNDWVINVKHLSSQSDKDGPDAIRTGLKELECCGYLKRDQSRNNGKFGQADYVVYEVSQNPCKQGDSTVSGFPDDGSADDGEPCDIQRTISTKTFSTKDSYRTAFFSKTAECGEALLNSGQDKPEDNCTTPPPNDRSPKKPSKPKKLFDGNSELSIDHNGWVVLPSAIDVAPRYRELIGPVVAQTMVWTKVWFVGHYSDELELTLHYQDDGLIYAISGKDFDVMAYSEFLSKDGPVPVKVMRDVVMDRTGGFQEEFNDVLSYYFWEAFRRALQRSA